MTTTIQSPNLDLVLSSPEEVRAWIDSMTPEERKEVSDEWLARAYAATAADPWIHGFRLVLRAENVTVGQAAFKGPPTEGVVEIAYGIEPKHQGKGYATEAAQALTDFAFASDQVQVVRAHTLPEANASTRVLTKCGFHHVGEVIDPDDGLVWRWEKTKNCT